MSAGSSGMKEVGAGDVGVGIDDMQEGQGKVPGDKHPGDEALPLVQGYVSGRPHTDQPQASYPNLLWGMDMTKVWCGEEGWAALSQWLITAHEKQWDCALLSTRGLSMPRKPWLKPLTVGLRIHDRFPVVWGLGFIMGRFTSRNPKVCAEYEYQSQEHRSGGKDDFRMVVVSLSKIIIGLESQSSEINAFLDLETGEVAMISDEDFRTADEVDDLDAFPDWQREAIELARTIEGSNHCIRLPSKSEIDEYKIMRRFCELLADDELSKKMYDSIRGSGAFRRFKDNIHRYGIADDWYEYRDRALRQIAIEWCEDNGITCIE